jgi:hypothetical protein
MRSLRRSLVAILSDGQCAFVVLALAILARPAIARSDTIFVVNSGSGTIGEYADSGATLNASLITGLNSPNGIALSGSDLFVANSGDGTIGEYTTSGATVNASLLSGLVGVTDVAVSGSNLFVLYSGGVGEFTTSGTTVNASLISVGNGLAMALSGSDLFILTSGASSTSVGHYTTSGTTVNPSLTATPNTSRGIAVHHSALYIGHGSTISVIDLSTGVTLNTSLISGLNNAYGIGFSGSNLFVVNRGTAPGTGSIGEYTDSGATVNSALITGLNEPWGIVVAPVPEPSTARLLSAGIVGIAARRRRAQLGEP